VAKLEVGPPRELPTEAAAAASSFVIELLGSKGV
jgi:hypothetical protein